MAGTQPPVPSEGVFLTAVVYEGLRVLVDGKPARLAIIDDDGRVLAAGSDVAREAEAVALNHYKCLLKADGILVERFPGCEDIDLRRIP